MSISSRNLDATFSNASWGHSVNQSMVVQFTSDGNILHKNRYIAYDTYIVDFIEACISSIQVNDSITWAYSEMHSRLVTYKEWYANFVWRCLGKFHTRWQKTLPHPRYLDLALEPGLESFPWSRFFHQLQTNLEPSTWIYYVQNHKLVNNPILS